MSLKLLRQTEDRRQVYFGSSRGTEHHGLGQWITFCKSLNHIPEHREQDILFKLKKIRFRIETRQKLIFWHLVTQIRLRHRFHEKNRCLTKWRKLFLLTRFKVLHAILDNVKPLVRHRFLLWKERCWILRAIEFYQRSTMRRVLAAFRWHTTKTKKSRLQCSFAHWNNYKKFSCKLKKSV
jgi:hypothetical protein